MPRNRLMKSSSPNSPKSISPRRNDPRLRMERSPPPSPPKSPAKKPISPDDLSKMIALIKKYNS